MTSEILADLCKRLASILRTHGVDTLDGIILDQSFFSSDITIDGVGHSSNPYDAPVGALSANFNSVFFKTDRKTNRPVTAEPETPLLPFVHQRINASGMRFGRIILNRDEGALYAGLLIKYFLKQDGIHVSENQNAIMATWKDTIITRNDHANGKNASVYSNDASRRNHKSGRLSTSHSEHVMDKIHLNENLIYTYTSPYDLKDIVQKLLKYSNNFIANQLFLTCGARSMGRPATIEKGITAGIAYAKKELGLDALRLEEGSGLSRKNRVSPMEMLKILVEFMPHHQLMSWQKNEGNSSKNLRDSEYGEFYKTGTLHGIRTRCGYFKTPRGLYPFVIMVNQQGKGYSKLKKTLWRRVIAAENRK